MKKLSKIVALLLAGALTMLLFTACGGGGGGNLTAQKDEEEKVVSLIGKSRTMLLWSMTAIFVQWQKGICERTLTAASSLETISSLPTSMWMVKNRII